jgi:membrane fusion protein
VAWRQKRRRATIEAMIELGKIAPRSTLSLAAVAGLVLVLALVLIAVLTHGRYGRTEEVGGYVVTGNIARVGVDRPGFIEQLLVKRSAAVVQGQPLARVRTAESDTLAGAGTASSAASVERFEELLVRIDARIAQARSAHASELRSLQGRLQQLDEETRAHADSRRLLERRVEVSASTRERYQALHRERYVSTAQLEDIDATHDALLQELTANRAAVHALTQRRYELGQARISADSALEAQLTDLVMQRSDIADRLSTAQGRGAFFVFAPAAGTVDTVHVRAGQEVAPGRPIMLLRTGAPSEPFVLLDVPSSAVGMTQVGAPVTLRVDAFPYERFGLLRGRVAHVAPGTTQRREAGGSSDEASYEVRVRLDDASFDRIHPDRLLDGMTVGASVRHEKLSLAQWLFLPVSKGLERRQAHASSAPAEK